LDKGGEVGKKNGSSHQIALIHRAKLGLGKRLEVIRGPRGVIGITLRSQGEKRNPLGGRPESKGVIENKKLPKYSGNPFKLGVGR